MSKMLYITLFCKKAFINSTIVVKFHADQPLASLPKPYRILSVYRMRLMTLQEFHHSQLCNREKFNLANIQVQRRTQRRFRIPRVPLNGVGPFSMNIDNSGLTDTTGWSRNYFSMKGRRVLGVTKSVNGKLASVLKFRYHRFVFFYYFLF